MKIENCKMKIENWFGRRAGTNRRFSVASQDLIGIPRDFARPPRRQATSSICNFQGFAFLTLCSLLFALCSAARAQVIADKTVASVSNGAQTTPDLITYSDLVWQLALEPDRPVPVKPSSAELKEALDLLIEQSLVLQEARKLPVAQTSEAQAEFEKTVQDLLKDLVAHFGSRARLQDRMDRVGLSSAQLDQILRDRATTDRYIDFRFRSFAVVSPKEIADRYEKDYGRRRGGERIVETLDQVRDKIEQQLILEKISDEIDRFKDSLREQPGTEIVIISPV